MPPEAVPDAAAALVVALALGTAERPGPAIDDAPAVGSCPTAAPSCGGARAATRGPLRAGRKGRKDPARNLDVRSERHVVVHVVAERCRAACAAGAVASCEPSSTTITSLAPSSSPPTVKLRPVKVCPASTVLAVAPLLMWLIG
mgnify:CR=1 FL=1